MSFRIDQRGAPMNRSFELTQWHVLALYRPYLL
jgi:hypothetical protein